MDMKKMAEDNAILRVVVGSEAYGISEGGSSDRDEKGVCIESFEVHVGFNRFEQYEFRSAAERTGKKDEPSGPGDLDLTIYSLRKFLHLALNGNPSIIEILFIKNYITWNALGMKLKELTPNIVSKKCGKAYLGYMRAQKAKLEGKVSVEGTERADLVAKYGYDTKYAGHMVRLGMQGEELMRTGNIVMPMIPAQADIIKAIRNGEYPLHEVMHTAEVLDATLVDLIDNQHTMQPEPARKAVEKWMIDTYWRYWSAQRKMLDLPMNSVIN
jgi:predicted nucleotidyltransferase